MFLEHLWKGKEESEREKKTGHTHNFILPTLEIVLEQQKQSHRTGSDTTIKEHHFQQFR